MNLVVFDTETVSIDKPFCYNVGFFKGEILVEHYIKTEKICQENFLIFSLDI